jgi:hypothetical protein
MDEFLTAAQQRGTARPTVHCRVLLPLGLSIAFLIP